MKKILIAFLFILTAIPVAFSVPPVEVGPKSAEVIWCDDAPDCNTPQYDKEKYQSIHGTIYFKFPGENFNEPVMVKYTADDGVHHATYTANPHFGFVILKTAPGTVTFTIRNPNSAYTIEPATYRTEKIPDHGISITVSKKPATQPTEQKSTPQTPAKPEQKTATSATRNTSSTSSTTPATPATEQPATPATSTPSTRASVTRAATSTPKSSTTSTETTHAQLNTVSGTVLDEKGQILVGAYIVPQGIKNPKLKSEYDTTDPNGRFLITNFPGNTSAEVSFMGYETKIIPASQLMQDMTINMQPEGYILGASLKSEVSCGKAERTNFHALTAKVLNDEICIPTSCENDYTLENEGKKEAQCVKCDTSRIAFSRNVRVVNNKCVLSEKNGCQSGFTPKGDNKCEFNCNDDAVLKALNATKAELKSDAKTPNGININYSDYCKATACDETRAMLENNICVSNAGTSCKGAMKSVEEHATGATYDGNGLCKLESCDNGYDVATTLVPRACDGNIPEFKGLKCSGKCVIKTDRDGTECTKNELKSMNIAHATAGTVKEWDKATGAVTSCTITECDDGWRPNATGDGCDEICTAETTQKLKNDGAFDVRVSDDGKTCVAKSCKCEYKLTDDGKCVPWAESKYTECEPKQDGATKGTPHCDGGKEVCYITTCDEPKYSLEGDQGTATAKCVSNVGKDCNDVVALPENATAGKQREIDGQMKCVATACKTGYDLRPDGSACIPKMVLSKEEYQDQIAELSDNAAAMHEKENSWENRLIGAAGIGLTGVGGMMVGSALSEQTADANAEATMRQYLETFRCDYGDGKLIHGGEVNVELPGGNDMIELYTEYATRAADLKARKEALGMRPGIESEIVIDKAETGLYEYSPDGITGGTYASIARALMDPEGEDAAMWAAQKEATANKLKAGAIVAGVGSVGSLAANIAVNHNNPNKVKELKQKYDAMRQPFQNLQQSFSEEPVTTPTPQTNIEPVKQEPKKQCADVYPGSTGSDLDHCTCVASDSYLTSDGCVQCATGFIVNDTNDGCKCPNPKQIMEDGVCKDPAPSCPLSNLVKPNKCECKSGASHGTDNVCNCDTSAGYTQQGSICVCDTNRGYTTNANGTCGCDTANGFKAKSDGTCEKEQPTGEPIARANIPSDSLFESGKADIKPEAKPKLDKFIADVRLSHTDLTNPDDYCLVIVGKTDHQGFKSTSKYYGKGGGNQKLSEDRANAVKDYIKAPFNETAIRTVGVAATDCPTPKKGESKANQECRRVDVIMLVSSCNENSDKTNWIEGVAQAQSAISAITNTLKK